MSTVDLPEFRDLLILLRPEVRFGDIPGRKKIADLAMAEFRREKDDIRKRLKVRPIHIPFVWTVLTCFGRTRLGASVLHVIVGHLTRWMPTLASQRTMLAL